ncbi:MAG: 2-oxo acid dehydrogenase subunit E2 [Rickettsiales bacterium]|nr:2-oxo acid dehydrogenase subunit E2 [Rickettsiales bacterium]
MVAEVKMPALSPTMTEGKIVSWNKNVGDKIEAGDVILEIETDKAVMEVEAQSKGVLGKILFELNQDVRVGDTIALIKEKNDTDEDIFNYQSSTTTNGKVDTEINTDIQSKQGNDNSNQQASYIQTNNNADISVNQLSTCKKIFASPLAKKIATDNHIDLEQISIGSGPNGRIIKQDIEKILSSKNSGLARNSIEYIDIEPTNMRKTIAKRLTESKQNIPHWYMKISPNMSNFVNFRNEINNMAKIDKDGKPEYKISATDLFVFAIAKAIQRNSVVNTAWIDGRIRKYNNIDIAIAVGLEDGVITPVVKNADQKNLIDLSKEIKNLVSKARSGKLNYDEYNGGCLTISNLGMFDVDDFCSIINPPQSCIIAISAIHNKPIANSCNRCEIQPVCNITFSIDHRVLDGASFAPFANDIKKMLENPALMFII